MNHKASKKPSHADSSKIHYDCIRWHQSNSLFFFCLALRTLHCQAFPLSSIVSCFSSSVPVMRLDMNSFLSTIRFMRHDLFRIVFYKRFLVFLFLYEFEIQNKGAVRFMGHIIRVRCRDMVIFTSGSKII